jgi:hypothetical protein
MGYYRDLFFRPKQAIQYANQNPSAIRSLGFVLLGTVASLLSMLVFANEIFAELLLTAFIGDVLRLIVGGFILLVIGIIFKKAAASADSFVRVISMLAHLSVYGFVIFVLLGLVMPSLLIPNVLEAGQLLNEGVIGIEEFELVVGDAVAGISFVSLLFGAVLALLTLVFGLLSLYSLYLTIHTFLGTTVFKTAVIMIVYALFLGTITGFAGI